jgi:thymidine phosphorylase
MNLSQHILEAADTIDKVNAHMEFGDKSTWNATELRHVAKAVEEEEQEAEQHQVLARRLAMDIFNSGWKGQGSSSLTLAETLIELGWRPNE